MLPAWRPQQTSTWLWLLRRRRPRRRPHCRRPYSRRPYSRRPRRRPHCRRPYSRRPHRRHQTPQLRRGGQRHHRLRHCRRHHHRSAQARPPPRRTRRQRKCSARMSLRSRTPTAAAAYPLAQSRGRLAPPCLLLWGCLSSASYAGASRSASRSTSLLRWSPQTTQQRQPSLPRARPAPPSRPVVARSRSIRTSGRTSSSLNMSPVHQNRKRRAPAGS